MKKNKGFTIPELLATIAIIGVLLTIAVGSYTGISNSIKKKTYQSKIKLIETKAYEYAVDNEIDNATISVARLINEGYLDYENEVADSNETTKNKRINNPLGGYLDCFNVNISRDVSEYKVEVVPSTDCTIAINDNINAEVQIYAFASKDAIVVDSKYTLPDDAGNKLYKALGNNNKTTWTNASPVYLYMDLNKFKDEIGDTNQATISWNYNGVITPKSGNISYTTTNDLNYANVFSISTIGLINTNITAKVTVGSKTITQKVNVKIDREKPIVKFNLNQEYVNATSQKEINLIGDDNNGSGIKAYAFESTPTASPNFIIDPKTAKVSVSDNGDYYAYALDNTGNISEATIVNVNQIDKDVPHCKNPISRDNNTWSTSYTYSYGCKSDNTTGCKTKDRYDTITTDMISKKINWTVEDNVGNTFRCENDVRVNVDVTPPTCHIDIIGTKGDNGWYKSNVTLILQTDDNFKDYGSIAATGLSTNSTPDYNGVPSVAISNSNEITYYGYVKDKAGNTGTCSTTVKVDSTAPSCNWQGESTSWTNSNRSVSVSCSDSVSGCATSGNTWNFTSGTVKTSGLSYTIKDNAGNTTTCSKNANVYVDKDVPTCNINASGTTGNNGWYKSNVNLSLQTDDVHKEYGLIAATGLSTSITSYYNGVSSVDVGNTNGTTYYGYVRDQAGNVGSCNTFVKVDTTAPSCNWQGESTSWTNSNRSISVGCSDFGSGCATSGNTWNFTSGTVKNSNLGYTITDNAGNSSYCSKNADVYVDKEPPSNVYIAEATGINFSFAFVSNVDINYRSYGADIVYKSAFLNFVGTGSTSMIYGNITVAANDSGSGVNQYIITGKGFGSNKYSCNNSSTCYLGGFEKNSFNVVAVDAAGNRSLEYTYDIRCQNYILFVPAGAPHCW